MSRYPTSARDGRVARRLALVVFLWLALFHRGHLSSSDEIGVLETTRALVEHGTLAVSEIPNAPRGPDGRRYSLYAVGQPLLMAPL